MTLEYYVYGSGGVVFKSLNAVATFFASATFGSLIQIATMIGAVATFSYFMLTRDQKHLWKWAAVFFLVPLCLLNMKSRLQVIDLTDESRVYSVDNVPYLVALPTHFFSTFMMGLTEGVETIFSSVNDEKYGRTGMVFGSRLYKLSRQSSIKDVMLKGQWTDFFKNCIVNDIEINGKYSYNDLYQSPDILAFLDSQTMSPLRGVYLSHVYYTCQEAYPIIKAALIKEADRNFALLGSYLYGNEASTHKADLENAMSNSYTNFLNMSKTSSEIFQQNLVMNAVRSGVSSLDSTGQSLNYAYTQNKMQTTAMWASIGLQAKEFVPLLHTILMLLFSCSSFFIAAVIMIPSMTTQVLGNYFKAFLNVATWPTFFAILNAFMMWSLEERSTGIASDFGGLTLSNDNSLDEMHTRFAAICGYLMMATPLISSQLLKGSAALMSSLNYQLAGMINSTNARTSAAAATGDLSFGNMQIANKSWNNESANKLDTNFLERKAGLHSVQNPDGTVTTTLGNNSTIYNDTGSVSNMTWGVNLQKQAQGMTQDAYRESLQTQRQTMSQLNDTIQSGVTIGDRWHDGLSTQKAYGEGSTTGIDSQILQGSEKMHRAVEAIQKETGASYEEAKTLAATVTGGVKTPGALFVSGGLEFSASGRRSWTDLDRESQQNIVDAANSYREGANQLEVAGHKLDNKESRTDLEQYANDFALNWGRTKTLMQNATHSINETNDLSNTLTSMESQSTSYNKNLMHGFQTFVEENKLLNAKDIMYGKSPELEKERQELFSQYVKSEEFKQSLEWQSPSQTRPVDLSPKATSIPEEQDILATHNNHQLELKESQVTHQHQQSDDSFNRVAALREYLLETRKTGAMFDEDHFNAVTAATEAKQQQVSSIINSGQTDVLRQQEVKQPPTNPTNDNQEDASMNGYMQLQTGQPKSS